MAGNFANLRPDNPSRFLEGLAEILEQYPAGLVKECCHARHGVAAKVEFLSQKALIDWLDKRLTFYQTLASYVPRERALPAPVFSDDHRERMLLAQVGLSRAMKERPADEVLRMSMNEFIELGRKDKPAQSVEAAE